MAKIYNSDVTKGLANNAGIQQSREKTPDELAEKIVPVMETNPKLLRNDVVWSGSSSTTGGVTAITAAVNTVDKKTFITGFIAGVAKNAACDVATGTLTFSFTQKDLGATNIHIIPVITLTDQNQTVAYSFKNPLELRPSTTVTFNGNFGAGVMIKTLAVFGYQIDNAYT